MRAALLAAVWVLVACVSPGIAQSVAGESARDRLIGSWRLAWVEEEQADGTMKRYTDRRGTIVYTRDGHMSVQIMLPEGLSVPGKNPVKYDRGSYEAYYGPYEVDEAVHTVTHQNQLALARGLLAADPTPVYRFRGLQLVL